MNRGYASTRGERPMNVIQFSRIWRCIRIIIWIYSDLKFLILGPGPGGEHTFRSVNARLVPVDAQLGQLYYREYY